MPHATRSYESANQPTTPASAMPQGLVNRFRDRIKSAHFLVGIALLGAASVPEIVQAQTSLPPITVIGTPPPGGGGFGGGGGGTGDPTGCGYECDGSAQTAGSSGAVAHVQGGDSSTCNADVGARNASANADIRRANSQRGVLNPYDAGEQIAVTYSDGGSELWVFGTPYGTIVIAPVPVPGTHWCP